MGKAWNHYLGAVGCIKIDDDSVSLAVALERLLAFHTRSTNMDLLLISSWRAVRRA